MPSKTMQTSIYYLDVGLFQDLDEDLTNDKIIESIIQKHNTRDDIRGNEQFKKQKLNSDYIDNFNIQVYYSEKNREPKWRGFLEPICNPNCSLVKGQNKDVSFVSFIYNDDHIFCISGGQGNFIVQDYASQSFGMDILARLISENSKVIKSLNERGLTGSILASTKFFRYDYKLTDDNEFGKLYKEIKVDLEVDILYNKFGFSKDDIKKGVGCIAKSTFKINKAIDMTSLINILNKINIILNTQPNFTLNKVKLLSRRGNQHKNTISILEKKIIDIIFDNYQDGEIPSFDICHRDFEKFLCADHYNLFEGHSIKPLNGESLDSINQIPNSLFAAIKEENIITSDQLQGYFEKLKLVSYDCDSRELTKGSFLKHLHGELDYNQKKYFYIDGEWYEIESEFLLALNKVCLSIIEESLTTDSLLTQAWNSDDDENDYNRKYIGQPNFIVLDKILAENIELCDLVHYDDNNLRIIHVKQGFDRNVRDLTSQIYISAKIINDMIKSANFEYLDRLYQSLKDKCHSTDDYYIKAGNQTKHITKKDFISLFANKKIVYCLAFTEERSIREIDRFKSNIAKYSLIELDKKLKLLGESLEMIQIS